MIWASEERAEWSVDICAAAIFAVAVGFAMWARGSTAGAIVTAAAASFLVAFLGLRRVTPEERTYAIAAYPLEAIEPMPEAEADELILEDELVDVSDDARVVQLFGSGQGHRPSIHGDLEPPDASQALSEALAELRRSLR